MSNNGDGKKIIVEKTAGAAARGGGRASDFLEDAPSMRSVSLMPAPYSGELKRSEYAIGPPPKGLGPVSLSKRGGTSAGGGLSVKKEWKGQVALPSCWQVKTNALEMASFPLERTHREIPGVETEEVCSRISEALRVLSIEAEYDDEKAKAKCRTNDYACFRIRLYAGSEVGQPVIVECQRRSGPGMSFMQSCRAILSAAEGKPITAEALKKKVPPFMKCPTVNMKCLQGVEPETVHREAEVSIALDKVIDLLRMDQHDSSVLAMENLCHLTDLIKTYPDTAVKASKTILVGDDDKYNIREEMTALLERDGVSPDFDHVDVGQSQADHLRHLALLVFSNALALIAKDGSLERAIGKEEWFGEILIPNLMDAVASCTTSPNNASVASCCLNTLMSCSTLACSMVRKYDGLQVIARAHQYGTERHELLANETRHCLNSLEAEQ